MVTPPRCNKKFTKCNMKVKGIAARIIRVQVILLEPMFYIHFTESFSIGEIETFLLSLKKRADIHFTKLIETCRAKKRKLLNH